MNRIPQAALSPGSTGKKVLAVLLLVLAASEYLARGPIQFIRNSIHWTDICEVYFPSRAWIKGLNPYSPEVFIAESREAANDSLSTNDIRTYSPYPLTSLVVFSPISSIPWREARFVWVMLITLAIGIMIWSLVKMGNLTSLLRICFFIAICLGLAPLHTGISVGNVSILAIILSCIAVYAASEDKHTLAITLLAIASCLKPQLGISFLLYYLLRKRFHIVLLVSMFGIAVLGLGALRLELNHVHWVGDFLRNAHKFTTECFTADFTEHNPIRFTLLNLQVLLYSFTHSTFFAQFAGLLFVFILFGFWYRFSFSGKRNPPELLVISTLAVLSILPVYHRNYDAALLVLPVCLVLSERKTSRSDYAISISILPFAIPGPALLQHLVDIGRIPQSVANGWWWNNFVMPHQIWALLFLSILLLYKLAFSTPDSQATYSTKPNESLSEAQKIGSIA